MNAVNAVNTVTLEMELTAVEADDLRRLADRLADRSGKPHDSIRRGLLAKLQKAARAADAVANKRPQQRDNWVQALPA